MKLHRHGTQSRLPGLIWWFSKRSGLVGHQALRRAAGRYGFLLSLAPLGVFALYLNNGSPGLLLATSLVSAATVFLLTYAFFTSMAHLQQLNENNTADLEQAITLLEDQARRIRHDMDRARVVQERLLPDLTNMPFSQYLEWGARFVPVEEVGGDYFDAAPLDEDRLALVFADVSGHGLSAALVTVIIKTTFESWIERTWDLRTFVEELNERLYRLTPDQSFAAVVAAQYDAPSQKLTYCNCGHSPDPVHIPAMGFQPVSLNGIGPPVLGAMEKLEMSSSTISLSSGDTVLLATDGITEALDTDDRQFGTAGLLACVAEHGHLPVSGLASALVRQVERHSSKSPDNDDRTVLAFRVR